MLKLSPTDASWLPAASIGFGCCLAAMESERYTAFWSFGSRSVTELAIIVALTALALYLLTSTRSAKAGRPDQSTCTLTAIVLVQMLGTVGKALESSGTALPESFAIVCRIALQGAGLLFVLYGGFFLRIGARKTMLAFSVAALTAGGVQIATGWMPPIAAYTTVVLLTPLSAVLLRHAGRHHRDELQRADEEDVRAESERYRLVAGDGSFAGFCVTVFLLLVLMMALSHQGILLQDGAENSHALQMASGASALFVGIGLLAVLHFFQELELVELARSVALPLVLVALYLSTLLGGSGLYVYMSILEICYLVVFVLVLVVPRGYLGKRQGFPLLCMAYFASRLGWAFGFWGFMILTPRTGNALIAALVLVSFGALLTLSVHRAIIGIRQRGEPSADREPEGGKDSEELFVAACDAVALAFELTARETEVLRYLAKGRNARYIAGALVISDGTARTHIMHIYQKTQVRSQQALMDIVDAEYDRAADEAVQRGRTAQ